MIGWAFWGVIGWSVANLGASLRATKGRRLPFYAPSDLWEQYAPALALWALIWVPVLLLIVAARFCA